MCRFTGKVAMVESSSARVKAWRSAVAAIARDAAPPALLAGALVVDFVLTMPRPQRFPVGDLRRVHGRPAVTPDLSKLARSTEDALTGIVWADDALAVAYRRLEKVYVSDPRDPDALRAPGAVIRVWEVDRDG